MKYLIIILIILISFSCVTERRCNQKFPANVEYIKKDSIVYKEKIVKHDTTIYVTLPKDTIVAHDTITIDKYGNLYVRPLVMKGKYSVATAWIFNNNLQGRLEEGVGDALAVTLKDAVTRADYYKEQYEKESKKETKISRENTPFAKFCIYFFFIFVVLTILGLIFIRFRK